MKHTYKILFCIKLICIQNKSINTSLINRRNAILVKVKNFILKIRNI